MGLFDFVGDFLGFGDSGSDASNASIQASETQAKYQREALNYLKEIEEIPQAFRQEALTKLGGIYDLEGGEGSQQKLIDQALASPLYGALMSGQEAGEESILRSAAATGGLRSGNVQDALYDYNTQLQNQALLSAYNEQLSGLQGLSGIGSNANTIAGLTSGIGTTLSQGQIAAAQAEQAASQQGFGNLLGLGQLGLSAYSSGLFSDRRLKKNIKLIGQVKGWNWYRWDWNIVAQKMGLKGECQGCMADEVYAKIPDAVILKDLFLWVCYPKIGVFDYGK